MAQWVRAPAIKPDNLSQTPRTYTVERELTSSELHIHTMVCPTPHYKKKVRLYGLHI